jgi:hypothetical protein
MPEVDHAASDNENVAKESSQISSSNAPIMRASSWAKRNCEADALSFLPVFLKMKLT